MTNCNSCETNDCAPNCSNVFALLHVSYLIRGGTRVMWQLVPEFSDLQPWVFQLQVGMTGNPNADDWLDVGQPMSNACYAIDPERRVYGKTQYTHYRVKLQTDSGVYYSQPTSKAGILNARDWRLAREVTRKEQLRNRFAAQDGYLLKRRILGEACHRCLDLQTNEVKDPYCPECFGTGHQCGYYYPMACIWADISPKTRRIQIDSQARGATADVVLQARMMMMPLIDELDVWVSKRTDDRYYIHTIQDVSEFRGVPLVASVELRPAAYSDPIYNVVIPQQDDWLQGH